MAEDSENTGTSAGFPEGGERIAKVLARAGVASRRDVEKLIGEGRVTVDGRTLDTPAFKVSGREDIRVDGARVGQAGPVRVWRYHKPAGLVSTHRDPQERRTIFDALPGTLPRVVSVGRLDLPTEGLLLLTTDGGLARHLELPATGWRRRYRVRAYGRPTERALAALKDGLTVDGVEYGPIEARLDSQQGGNAWMTMVITEGKNREIRTICRHLDLTVNRLIRTGYGPFQLGNLAKGAVEEVPRKQLVEQLGRRAAARLGV